MVIGRGQSETGILNMFIVVTMSKTCESQCSILVVTINNMF